MTKRISILGSTGSIGTQTLDVVRNLGIEAVGLAANRNIDLLEKQILEFKPRAAAVGDERLAHELEMRLAGNGTRIFSGIEGFKKIAALEESDTVVTSIVGIAGLVPTMEAIRNGKNIALANKETLVTAGELVTAEALRQGIKIIPVDSEHSAIFQCINGNNRSDISKIILTASGGPFRGRKRNELNCVKVEDALKHPNWSMGRKITIDSATLMNKGLEVIEARWLFGIDTPNIQVLIHPQSVIHSAVEYVDGSVIAQLGAPDMRIPIQYALTYPDRRSNSFSRINLLDTGRLTFEEPDVEAFPCLRLAFEALKAGGTMPAAMNAAYEAAVGMFLEGEIGFMDIPAIIEKVMDEHSTNINPLLEDIIEVDRWARSTAAKAAETLAKT
jgi:1-deoxy-D-xylulose-5-phosphate reductoisomerase